MFELLFCSVLTILPDFLFRRFGQGKRLGKEITFYSVWYELRWGITCCILLTIALITLVFYNHPATTSVTMFYRTVPVLPETNGRVAEIYVGFNGHIEKGAPIFKLDGSKQQAAVDTAARKIAETDADIAIAKLDAAKAEAQIQEAESSYKQAVDELTTKQELQRRNSGTVAQREIEKLQVVVEGRNGTVAAAKAAKASLDARVATLLPAERASAEAALAQAQVELEKTIVRAGVSGQLQQFTLRVGDVVNPLMRPAGILVPDRQSKSLQAGFGQIEAQVMKEGMIAEAACISKPWVIIPLVVTYVQENIPAGQFRGGELLIDPQQTKSPGTIFVNLEPLYKGDLDDVTPGSSCIANAYSSHHDEIAAKDTGALKGMALHMVDAVGLVHALLLRVQAVLMPFKLLVFSDGH
jgi:multidrug resistance efflux pump